MPPLPGTRPPTPAPGTRPPTPALGTRPPTPALGTRLPTPAPSTRPLTPVPGTRPPTPAPGTRPPTPAPGTGHQASDTRTGHQASDTRTGHQASNTRTRHQASDTRTGNQASNTRTGHQASDTRTGNQASDTRTGHQASDTRTGNQASDTCTGNQASNTRTGNQASDTRASYAGPCACSVASWLLSPADKRQELPTNTCCRAGEAPFRTARDVGPSEMGEWLLLTPEGTDSLWAQPPVRASLPYLAAFAAAAAAAAGLTPAGTQRERVQSCKLTSNSWDTSDTRTGHQASNTRTRNQASDTRTGNQASDTRTGNQASDTRTGNQASCKLEMKKASPSQCKLQVPNGAGSVQFCYCELPSRQTQRRKGQCKHPAIHLPATPGIPPPGTNPGTPLSWAPVPAEINRSEPRCKAAHTEENQFYPNSSLPAAPAAQLPASPSLGRECASGTANVVVQP
uniref:Uncharacterized protein n=1 Tax=Pelusios castaneus TaxID=367368 RepID=A0A8C8RHT1_9SAUR